MGLRERKKERTQRAIEDAALRLFGERGFDQVTIAEIAEAAEISPRTFFGYFPSKESLLFPDFDASLDGLIEALRTRGADATAIDALEKWITAMLERPDPLDDREPRCRRIIDANESLAAFERGIMQRFEVVLTEAVADDLGASPADQRPRLIAAAATAALSALRPHADAPPPSTDEEMLGPLHDALAFLRGGIDALAARERRST